MKKLAGIIAAAALAVPGFASAQPGTTMKLFDDLCVSTKAKAADVMAKARAQGFVRPPEALGKALASAEIPNAVGQWRVVDGGLFMVLTGDGPIPFDDEIDGDICAIMAFPSEANVEKQMQTFLGLGAPERISEMSAFIFDVQDGKRRQLSSKAGLSVSRAVERGNLQIAIAANVEFMDKENATIVMLMTPRAKRLSDAGATKLSQR